MEDNNLMPVQERDLVEAFLTVHNDGPSFATLLTKELRKNLYIDDTVALNMYFYSFFMGFLNTIMEREDATRFGINGIFCKKIFATSNQEGQIQTKLAGMKIVMPIQGKDTVKRLHVTTVTFGDPISEFPIILTEEERQNLRMLSELSNYKFGSMEYNMKKFDFNIYSKNTVAKEIFVKKDLSSFVNPSNENIPFIVLVTHEREYTQNNIPRQITRSSPLAENHAFFPIVKSISNVGRPNVWRILDLTIDENQNKPSRDIYFELVNFLGAQYRFCAKNKIFTVIRGNQGAFTHGAMINFKSSGKIETIAQSINRVVTIELRRVPNQHDLHIWNANPISMTFTNDGPNYLEARQRESLESFRPIRPFDSYKYVTRGHSCLVNFENSEVQRFLGVNYIRIPEPVEIDMPKHLINYLVTEINGQSIVDPATVDRMAKVMEHEIRKVIPEYKLYKDSNKNYLSRYVMGLIAGSKSDEVQHTLISKTETPLDTIFMQDSVNLMATAKNGKFRIIFSIRENEIQETEQQKVEINDQIDEFLREQRKIKDPQFDTIIFDITGSYVQTAENFMPGADKATFQRFRVNARPASYNNILAKNPMIMPLKSLKVGQEIKETLLEGVRDPEDFGVNFRNMITNYDKYLTSQADLKAFVRGLFNGEKVIFNLYKMPKLFSVVQVSLFIDKAHLSSPDHVSMSFVAKPQELTYLNEIALAYVASMGITIQSSVDRTNNRKLVTFAFDFQQPSDKGEKLIIVSGDHNENAIEEEGTPILPDFLREETRERINGEMPHVHSERGLLQRQRPSLSELLLFIARRIFDLVLDYCQHRLKRTPQNCIEDKLNSVNPDAKLSVLSYKVHLFKLNHVSSMVMNGFLVRDIVVDLIKWDTKALIHDATFLGSSIVASSAAAKLGYYGEKLLQNGGQSMLGLASRTASVAIGKSVLLYYIISDLRDNLHMLKNSTAAKVSVGNDIAILTLEGVDITAQTLEIFGLVEGVSAVTGPLAAVTTAVALIGINVYQAVTKVQQIESEVELTGEEKFIEGLRAFVHLEPEKKIIQITEEKIANEHSLNLIEAFLLHHSYIKNYVTEARSGHALLSNNYIDFCKKVQIHSSRATPAIGKSNKFSLLCEIDEEIVKNMNENFFVRLWHKIEGLFSHSSSTINTVLGYNCTNSFAVTIHDKKLSNATFFQLGNGNDIVYGFKRYPNIFNMSNGHKMIYGGNSDDIFILSSTSIRGVLEGSGGYNTLDLSFSSSEDEIFIRSSPAGLQIYSQRTDSDFNVNNIQQITGRHTKVENFRGISCGIEKLDLFGGIYENNADLIEISDAKCNTSTTISLNGYTKVVNLASAGKFTYIVNPHSFTNVEIHGKSAESKFTFLAHSLKDVQRIVYMKSRGTFTTALKDKTMLNVAFQNAIPSISLVFNDTVNLKFDSNGFLIAQLYSRDSISTIIEQYESQIQRLNLTMVAHSELSKESITINHGSIMSSEDNYHDKFSIVHNDPEHATHLSEGLGHHIVVLNTNGSVLKDVTVYLNSNNTGGNLTIDLTHLKQKMAEKYDSYLLKFELFVKDFKDLIVQLFLVDHNTLQILIGQIAFIDGAMHNNYKRISMLNNLQLEFNSQNGSLINLKPSPLSYNIDTIFLDANSLEFNSTIIILKSLNTYDYYRLNDSLLFTNIETTTMYNAKNTVSIIFHKFFQYNFFFNTLLLKFDTKIVTIADDAKRLSGPLPSMDDLIVAVEKIHLFQDNDNGDDEI